MWDFTWGGFEYGKAAEPESEGSSMALRLKKRRNVGVGGRKILLF